MAIGRSRATFPDSPSADAPGMWMSIDPASGRKPSVAVVWDGAEAVGFVKINHRRMSAIHRATAEAELVVLEGGGFVGANAAAALGLERVRGRFEMSASCHGTRFAEVSPDQWRSVLCLQARPRKRAIAAARAYVRLLHREGTIPRCALAEDATNDDRRAALLIGWACVLAWEWL